MNHSLIQKNIIIVTLLLFFSKAVAAQGIPLNFGNGAMNGVIVTTSSSQGSSNGSQTINGQGAVPNMAASSRFLGQATLGADMESVTALANMSFNQWIETQFATPQSMRMLDHAIAMTTTALDSTVTYGGDPNNIRPEMFYWQSAWWQYTMTSPDVLRNRIALALSEIFVVSEVAQLRDYPLALAYYYDMLLDNSFGNFRDLLQDVTFSPAMGLYLTHVNNPKSLPLVNRFPDENYAREIMQLFTIGLYKLNQDGTVITDSLGNPLQTYTNEDIAQFAKVFTGMTYSTNFLFGQGPSSDMSFISPMIMYNSWHESGTKTLLNGFVIPNRVPSNGVADVEDALDNLFNHPNVGPFIAYKLIQRLVKSNPSHEYIGRVAAAFNNNGFGIRGDMKAVIKAILLDDEARNCAYINEPFQGMLREPLVRYAQVCRTFNAASPSGLYRNQMNEFYSQLFQRALGSPSVFNFFQPWYQPNGPIDNADKVAPEFQITNSLTILGYANRLHEWVMQNWSLMEYGGIYNNEQYNDNKLTYLNLTDELLLGDAGEENQLIERLNLLLCHGNMSATTRSIIRDAIVDIPSNQLDTKVRMAIFLTMISPDYLIIR